MSFLGIKNNADLIKTVLTKSACLLWLLFFCSSTYASRNSISFLQIGTEQGLPQSTVNTIFQDSQGFIWIGTYDGVTRYDGYQFVNFKNIPQDSSSISNNVIVSIIEDDEGGAGTL